LDQIGYPIGWALDSGGQLPWFFPAPQACIASPGVYKPSPDVNKPAEYQSVVYKCQLGWWIIPTILGWGITALAIMLGAPFWFDVLNKFMVVRSTIKPKEKSPDEPAVDRTSGPSTVVQSMPQPVNEVKAAGESAG